MKKSTLFKLAVHPADKTLVIQSPTDEEGIPIYHILEAEWRHDEKTDQPILVLNVLENNSGHLSERTAGIFNMASEFSVEPGQEVAAVMKISGKGDEQLKLQVDSGENRLD